MKEREEKKGRLTVEHSVLGAEEPTETHLDLTSDLPQETASQEGEGTSLCHSGLQCCHGEEALLAVPQAEVAHCVLCTWICMGFF